MAAMYPRSRHIGEPTSTDAILDRLARIAYRIELTFVMLVCKNTVIDQIKTAILHLHRISSPSPAAPWKIAPRPAAAYQIM